MKKKFLPAFHGLRLAFGERSVRIQTGCAAAALAAGIILHLNSTEWLAVILCIGLVLSAEIMNTAVEKLCDLYTDEYDERIRRIKDLAAGAVLFAAMTALAAAVLILLQHIGGNA